MVIFLFFLMNFIKSNSSLSKVLNNYIVFYNIITLKKLLYINLFIKINNCNSATYTKCV